MRSLAKRILPESIKAGIKNVLLQRASHHARMARKTYWEWLFKSYHPKYQADKAPLMSRVSNFESLFEASEDQFKTTITPHVSEFAWSVGEVYNGQFVSIDPELYYSMIRQHKPSRIIEIGSGYSTHFAIDALRMNQTGQITCIDPEPRRSLPKGVTHIEAKVEEVGTDVFADLGENDILFVDSSHTTEEAIYHCQQILPHLGKGVIVHHHDFTFPYDIHYGDDPVVFDEPGVLLEFYSANRDSFEVLVCASYVRFRNPDLVNRLIESYRWNPLRVPGSLWTRKKD